MHFHRIWQCAALCFTVSATAGVSSGSSHDLHTVVTWDKDSFFVHGERLMLLSGEVHPFRLPSPDLWLDVLQKVRALGFNAVSFYVNWALIEGEPGQLRAEGIFALDKFFEAATIAGVYLIARPGPYINAETSGGGLPGWLQTIPGALRSTSPSYLEPAEAYLAMIGGIISNASITKGGPVILVQAENEYSVSNVLPLREYLATGGEDAEVLRELGGDYLSPKYMGSVRKAILDAGVDVPQIHNDAWPIGNFAPGSGVGATDIYGHDNYPFAWADRCQNTSLWPTGQLPSKSVNYTRHLQDSPSTPYSISEYQGGAPSPWGGSPPGKCAGLIGPEFERIFYKAALAQGVRFLSLYMVYGGTNWGNLGYAGGYTSYDVGAAISEDRQVDREKYSELKLQAHFLRVSPAYYTATPEAESQQLYTAADTLSVTRLVGSPTAFYVVRHIDSTALSSTSYTLTVNTTIGLITIPQLSSSRLALHGRDSKVHVTDYDVGGVNLLYSSAEVFTWAKSGKDRISVLLYGGENETHEFAVSAALGEPEYSGCDNNQITDKKIGDALVLQWSVSLTSTCIATFPQGLQVYLLWRNQAYNYWAVDVASSEVPEDPKKATVIVHAGYLVRNASIVDNDLFLTGDINTTTTLSIIAAPSTSGRVFWNGQLVMDDWTTAGTATLPYTVANVTTLDVAGSDWRYIDSLPELDIAYDDELWTQCNKSTSFLLRNLTTLTSLYAGDYGYYAGSLLYRGHFTANGDETSLNLSTSGGAAYAHSIWLNGTFIDSWTGSPSLSTFNGSYSLERPVVAGEKYVFTVLIDHMGLEQQSFVDAPEGVLQTSYGLASFRTPRGILDYALTSGQQPGGRKTEIDWRMTGNLGGTRYRDHTRGPLNEGSLFAERQGYHLPGAPTESWERRSPLQGLAGAGVGFFSTQFELDVPRGFDVPMSFVFDGSNNRSSALRGQLFVNGYQFGKYVQDIGPQTSFPIPEGVLNHCGTNHVALTLWNLDNFPVALMGLRLQPQAQVMTGYRVVKSAPQTKWEWRDGAY